MSLTLEEAAAPFHLNGAQIDKLAQYLQLLQKWNAVYNLSAVRDPADMLTHHIFDSLSLLPTLQEHCPAGPTRILDVGSGAGLPGIVLAIAFPEWQITCIDTVGKKAAFIRQAALQLQLPNALAVHARVEQWSADPFHLVVSRAFASLADFARLTHTHLHPDGVWVAMKGKHPREEIAALPATVNVFHVEQLAVPGLQAERCLVMMKR